ncbi:putative holin-like toxin [Cytobacillus sp. FJAT-53684]|uniref:Holin-like toxin n=1 Tax=Cytobacillus mangrovibacter TaxID=3299024 RepID=A0ABW6K0Z2_9BACI
MVTYEAMNMLIQFGIFLATALTALVAMIALVTNSKKKWLPPLSTKECREVNFF